MSAQVLDVVPAERSNSSNPAPAVGGNAVGRCSHVAAQTPCSRADASLLQQQHLQARLQGVYVRQHLCVVTKHCQTPCTSLACACLRVQASAALSVSSRIHSKGPLQRAHQCCWHLKPDRHACAVPHLLQVATTFRLARDDLGAEGWQQLCACVPQMLQQPSNYKPAVHLMLQFEVIETGGHGAW